MDDLKVGQVIRVVRLRRRLRQSDVAAACGLSQTFVSQLERGMIEQAALRSLRQVAGALGIRVLLNLHWRGPELAKLLDERHAALVLACSRRLSIAGWIVTVERTFSFYGERGSIDIVAWHPLRRAFLIVEVKSELVDVQDLFSTASAGWRRRSPARWGWIRWSTAR